MMKASRAEVHLVERKEGGGGGLRAGDLEAEP